MQHKNCRPDCYCIASEKSKDKDREQVKSSSSSSSDSSSNEDDNKESNEPDYNEDFVTIGNQSSTLLHIKTSRNQKRRRHHIDRI
jgi:hypothetical protein